MNENILISGGDVIGVQIATQAVVLIAEDGGHGVVHEQGDRVRLFVREDDGQERSYDLQGVKQHVREGQRVMIARARLRGRDDPAPLALFNISSDDRDLFEPGFRALLDKPPAFGVLLKTLGLTLALFVLGLFQFSIVVPQGREAPYSALFLALLFSPVFWLASSFWQRRVNRARYRKARDALVRHLEGRLPAFVKKADA